jgi:TonB family protein
MKISVIALCVWIGIAAQSDSLEKQAISIAQQTPVSSLDAQMPNRPLADWFRELVGRGAGAVVPATPQKISQSVLESSVIKKRSPSYPMSARFMNAMGKVEVRIVISEGGTVIEAEVISGHAALRNEAVDAAKQWVFKPTTINGVPTKVETVLTFNFFPPSQ